MCTSFEIVGKCCGTIPAKVHAVYYSSSFYFTVVFTKADKGLFTWREDDPTPGTSPYEFCIQFT